MVATASKSEIKNAQGVQVFEPWYHPTYKAITLRPSANHTIVLADFKVVPQSATDDEWIRNWVRAERRGNDPERWHGDNIPAEQPDLECGFCKALFRNFNVLADHLHALHLREELVEMRRR